MKHKILAIALILIIHLTTLTACAQTKVNGVSNNGGKEQVGNVLFVAPKNWQRLDKAAKDASTNGQTIFIAPNSNQSTVITILPDEQLFGSLETWFKDFLTKNHSKAKVISGGGIVKASSEESYPILLSEATLKENDGSLSYRLYVAAHPGNKAEVIALISTNPKEYQQYKSVFDEFIKSVDFANVKAGNASKSNSRSDNNISSSTRSDSGNNASTNISNNASNDTGNSISSNSLKGLYVGTESYQQLNFRTNLYDYIVRQQYYLFAPGGKVYFGLPKTNIRNIDLAFNEDPNKCGEYFLQGNQLQLTRHFQGETKAQNLTLSKVKDGFTLGKTRFYPINPSPNGLKLNGFYLFKSFTNISDGVSGGITGSVNGERAIAFDLNGNFVANNFVGLNASGSSAAITSSSKGSKEGKYQINGNTLTLTYSNGQQEELSFFIYPENEQESRPGVIVIGGVSYLLRN